jgi:phage terminase large subunit-like protein
MDNSCRIYFTEVMRLLKDYTPTRFMAPGSYYDQLAADIVCGFISCLKHTGGQWAGEPFDLIPWQEQLIRDIFGVKKANGYRQFRTCIQS